MMYFRYQGKSIDVYHLVGLLGIGVFCLRSFYFNVIQLKEKETDMAKYDLTSALAPYLDRHLVFPLLEFLSAKKVCMYCVLGYFH